MAESQSRLEINPKVIDLGGKVVQLAHVVSAGHEAVHPFRMIGLGLLAASIGLVGNEIARNSTIAALIASRGSLPLWLGCVAAVIGLFLALYTRRMLVICTSDGARTILPAASEEAAAALLARIRQAIEFASPPQPAALPQIAYAEPAALPAHTAPPQQMARPAARPLTAEPSPHTQPPAGYVNGHSRPGIPGPATGPADLSLGDALAAQRRSTMPVNPHAASRPGMAPERRYPGALPPQQGEGMGQLPARDAPLALPPSALPAAAPRDDGAHDLGVLIDHVRRADVQHKEALLDLLRVVDDYYRGQASREDAVAHWRSFADYVIQYLSDVDGLIAHTERFGRHMLAR